MASEVKNLFLEVENLIKLQLQDKVQNQPEVEKIFEKVKSLIDDLEAEVNVEEHGLFRYRYHTKYASYLKAVREVDDTDTRKQEKQENLAKKYEKYAKKSEEIDFNKKDSILFVKATLKLGNNNEASIPKENYMQELEEELKMIQDLEDKVIEDIRQFFKQIINEELKSFDDYRNIVIYDINLLKIIDNLINETLISVNRTPEELETSNTNQVEEQIEEASKNKIIEQQQFISSLVNIKLLANKVSSEIVYEKRITFIRHVLISPNKKDILYSTIMFTEEEINKRFRELALHFHPDKTNQSNTSNRIQDKDKHLGTELFRYVQEFKESLLGDLEKISKNEGTLNFHEKKGTELWKITVDYRNAVKGQWDKLKSVNKEDIKDIKDDDLKRFSEVTGILAYREYRAACRIADNAKLLKKQVKLRGSMALCLYVSNKFLEAQLYALSAILLLYRNSQQVTQDLIDARKIFDKVKGTEETPRLSTETKLEDNLDNTLALVKDMDQEISFFKKNAIQRLINSELAKISAELIFKPERSLIRYQASNEEILLAKKRAFRHKVAGAGTMAAGVGVGGVVTASIQIYEATILFGGTLGGPITFLGLASLGVMGVATFGLGIWGGTRLMKKGALLYKEPKIREKLNEIMSKALSAYDKGEHQKFLEVLSEEYGMGISLLKFRKEVEFINYQDIVDIINELLNHGFRSDGIAYLLNLLGEVLSGGKIKIEQIIEGISITTKELKMIAKCFFRAALHEKLREEAIKLDDRICELRKSSYKSYAKSALDFLLLKEYSGIAQEHKDDAQEMPFQARLEEMRNIARMNLAIFDLLDADPEEIKRAKNIIEEIRNSITHNYQFVSTEKSRLEVLENLLWVIGGYELPEKSPEESPKDSFKEIQYDKYFDYLNEKLQQTSSKQEKIQLYNNIAAYYEQLAENEDKVDQLKSLCHWQAAQKHYENSRELDPENLDASLGFAKCLLKLSKYTQVIKLFNISPALTSSSEYWRLCSIAHQKQINYKRANECIIESLRRDSQNKLADKQRALLKKLNKENMIEHRINCYEKEKEAIKYENDYLKNSYNDNNPVYNILSIDGGGIRGVLPALWLSEIEHRAHRPISHLFNMIAGTSTGGIIAAGLSAPHRLPYDAFNSISSNDHDYSDFKPLFSASELLSFVQSRKEYLYLFTDPLSRYDDQLYPLYLSDIDKAKLFRKHFNKTRLNKALTELVIPAFNLTQSSYLFTRYDACSSDSKNDTFVDMLMATTAAPTFFPAYQINDKGYFLDGGICFNNPAMEAYHEAIRYQVANEKISVLSLGTGSYIPDPLKPDLYWDQLFWAQNNHKVVFPAQECNVDSEMYDMLENRYQRWQVWFEKPIRFSNDYNSIPDLLKIGNQYIEELDASDENPINKLVESFEKRDEKPNNILKVREC